MKNQAHIDAFGNLPVGLFTFGIISLFIGSLTQEVGPPLAAPITASALVLALGLAMRFGYRWRRSAFVLFFPVALWLLWAGVAAVHGDSGGSVGFGTPVMRVVDRFNPQVVPGYIFDSYGYIELLLCLAGLIFYLYGLVRIVVTLRRATLASSPDGPGTFGALISIGVLTITTFVFGWASTASSSAFHLLLSGDFQGIVVCLIGLSIAAVFAFVGFGVWWRHRWRHMLGVIAFLTGTALVIHALYFSVITGRAFLSDGALSGMGGPVVSLIIGRFVFAGLLVWVGSKFLGDVLENAA